LVVLKSEYRCNTKFVEGTVQERTTFPFNGVMFNNGTGVDCEVQIAPLVELAATAANLLPSAEEATDCHCCHSEPPGTPFEIQVVPELVEV
jgi:hypothetical protein